MMKSASILVMASLAALLGGCGERDQSLESTANNRPDAKPWQGANNPYVAKGWNAGDQKSWETQIRTRTLTQNEYGKVK